MTATAGSRRVPGPVVAIPPLQVALVNNMPDAAFEEAEWQFTELVRAGAGTRPVEVRLSSIPDAGRCEQVQRRLAERYEDLDELYRRPPDALIVTGSEPRCADLQSEPQWPHLARLVRWAAGATSSAVYSCLAAHAALLELCGAERRPLECKASGVYRQSVRRGGPLTAGLGPVACPHSRYNEVPTAAVTAAGFDVLLESPASGWTMAVAGGDGLTVLLQGHPEYAPTTLLREYRRDVGRYLAGRRAAYPDVPAGYLDAEGVALLEAFRLAAAAGVTTGEFPFEAVADHVAVEWRAPMVRLFGNWLTEVEARRAQRTWRRAG